MEHKTSTSSTSSKYERNFSLVNALAKELAEIGDEINNKFPYHFDSISYSEQFYIVKNVTKHNPSRNCADSKMKFNPKSEKRRFFYYATPVLILAYFLYWRKS
ncbi:unnamed protein product [Trichobilharzia regenti]|nr:unnamed protein product [Trichobilharzia regenti]